jgi:hypothetical protein
VSDLALPVQTQIVHQHSTRRDVLIGLTVGAPLLAMLTASLVAVRILFGNRNKLRKTLSEDLRRSLGERNELAAESRVYEMERFGRFGYLFDGRKGVTLEQQDEHQKQRPNEQARDEQLQDTVKVKSRYRRGRSRRPGGISVHNPYSQLLTASSYP